MRTARDGFGAMQLFDRKDDANNTMVIKMRDDTYVNATAMCQSVNKRMHDYLRMEHTKKFLHHLASDVGTTIDQLVQTKKGGIPAEQGTWVHPRVATHLAHWISSKFAERVTKWIEHAKTALPNVKQEYNHELHNIRPDIWSRIEREVQQRLADTIDGARTEVEGVYGAIDLVSRTHVVEIKHIKKMVHALGQVLAHSETFPHLQKHIHLFGSQTEVTPASIEAALRLCTKYDVGITYETVNVPV